MAKFISKRAETARDWEDFLCKYLYICSGNEFDENTNPTGYINLGTAVNNISHDIICPRLLCNEVWTCDTSLLQYKDAYGIRQIREAFAKVMTEFFDPYEPVSPDNLFFTVGVTAGMDLLGHCLADPGDVFLAPTPIYGRVCTDIKQRSLVDMWHIPIITKDNKESQPALTLQKVKAAYEDAISKGRVVRGLLLVNPNNPLGDVLSPELLMDILLFCHEHSLHVIFDEVYALSVYPDGPEFYSVLKFPKIPDPERTHVLYGISKDFGIAGLRIGAIYTKCDELQKCLVQLCFLQHIPFPVMDVVARFLKDSEWNKVYVTENKRRLAAKYHSSASRLRKMGLKVREANAGFFLWVNFHSVCGSESFEDERDFFHYLIEKAHLYIVPGQEFFCAQPGWFRLVFSSSPNHVDEGLNRLEKAILDYKALHSKFSA